MTPPSVVAPVENIPQPHIAQAFDGLAGDYDELFTCSAIGRAQRDSVWRTLADTFHAGDHVLEINCGTGEDAIFMGRLGLSVVACDASAEMVSVARRRLQAEAPDAPIQFLQLPTEAIASAGPAASFDGVFSNFSGLNCVKDLQVTAEELSRLVRPGAALLLCMSTRFCLMEAIYFLTRGAIKRAFRRWSGRSVARIAGIAIDVHYPSVRQLRSLFAPAFRLVSYSGVGVGVPPSYMEGWVRRHPGIFKAMCQAERSLAMAPIFRVTGDHVLLRFEKEAA